MLVDVDVHVQEQHPKEYSLLRTVQIQSGDWGLRQPLEKMGFQSTPDFHKTLREYWRQHFFSSQFLHHDQPYVGAIEYVTALQDIGAQIYYLTGRDQLNMRKGTIQSLSFWGLPLAEDTRLIMKPHKGSHEDDVYKDLMMQQLIRDLQSQRGHVPKMWFFENEPVILHKLKMTTPHVNLIWVDTTHSGRGQPPTDLTTVRAPWVY